MFLTTLRDTSVSPSSKIHCRGTIRFTLKRRDITRSQKEKQSTNSISFFFPSSSALCRVLDWSNRTLVNGRNRFHRRSTTNSPRRNFVEKNVSEKKTTFRLDSQFNSYRRRINGYRRFILFIK